MGLYGHQNHYAIRCVFFYMSLKLFCRIFGHLATVPAGAVPSHLIWPRTASPPPLPPPSQPFLNCWEEEERLGHETKCQPRVNHLHLKGHLNYGVIFHLPFSVSKQSQAFSCQSRENSKHGQSSATEFDNLRLRG